MPARHPVRRARALALASLLLATGLPAAHAWRSTLYPADWQPPNSGLRFDTDQFLQDFSYAGYRRGESAIPSPAGPVFDVTAAPYSADPTGVNDSTAAIQAAIDAAETAGGGVVRLPAGTYRVQPPTGKNHALRIRASGIVLRGDGPDQTRLLNASPSMRNKSVILVQASSPLNWRADGPSSGITSDTTGPATKLTVSNPALFTVGDWVCVRNDLTDAWITEHKEPSWLGQGATIGGLAYLRRVTAVDATSITLDIPTRYALKTRDSARVVKVTAPLTEIGIEKLSLANLQHPQLTGWGEDDYAKSGTAAYACHSSYLLSLTAVVDAWVRDVETFAPATNTSTAHYLSNGIRLDFCRSVSIVNCTFERPQYGGGGGNGYAYRLEDSSDNLLDRCTAAFTRHGYLFSGIATSGNVLHRCTDRDTARYTGPNGSVVAEGRGSEHHAHFSHSNLVDACTADSSLFLAVYRPFGSIPRHNLTASSSVFWNTQGTGDPQWEGAPGTDVVASQQSGYGYVIGTRGTRTGVNLNVYYGSTNSAARTAPLDFVEGVGQGSDLTPVSLYEDQVARRIGALIFSVSAGESAILSRPQTTVNLAATVTSGDPQALAPDATAFAWTVVRNAGPVQLSSATGANVTATLSEAGVYEFQVTGTWNGQTATDSVIYELRGVAGAARTVTIPVDQDATVRNGTFARTRYGAEHELQMKFSESAQYQRQILLQFTPLPLLPGQLASATLLLQPSNKTQGYTAAVDLLANARWNEATVTWATQPLGGIYAGDWLGSDAQSPAIDLTGALKNALAANARTITLRLRATTSTGSDGVVAFRSREGSVRRAAALRLVVNSSALPLTPVVRILTTGGNLPAGQTVTIRGSVRSGPSVTRISLVPGTGSAVKARLDSTGRFWTAKIRLRSGSNKIIVLAKNRAGYTGRISRVFTAR